MQSLSPNIFVKDINATIEFYQKLGFQLVASVPETGDYVWVMMVNSAVSMMFQTFESLGEELPHIHRNDGGSLLLYIQRKKHPKIF
jgi:predicted lactoylglutathione lyase